MIISWVWQMLLCCGRVLKDITALKAHPCPTSTHVPRAPLTQELMQTVWMAVCHVLLANIVLLLDLLSQEVHVMLVIGVEKVHFLQALLMDSQGPCVLLVNTVPQASQLPLLALKEPGPTVQAYRAQLSASSV